MQSSAAALAQIAESQGRARQAASDTVKELAGGRVTIDVARLPPHLNLRVAPRGKLKPKGTSYAFSGIVITLEPSTVVAVRQRRITLATVLGYIATGGSPDAIWVTDIVPGVLHHLNGLHRLVAARLLGQAVDADVYR